MNTIVKVQVLELEDQYARFVVEGANPYFVNALRRVLLSEVPKLAIDEVTFYNNTSALTDEIVAHRLAMLPLPTPKDSLNMLDMVDEEGNPQYVVYYKLTAVATEPGITRVYSGQLECDRPELMPVDKEIPIVDLMQGQEIIFEAKAILGVGRDHVKFQPAQAVGYQYYPTAEISKDLTEAQVDRILEGVPHGILGKEKGKLVVLDELRLSSTTGHRFEGEVGRELYNVKYDDRKFVFQFETDGSLKPEDALLKAVEILRDRYKLFQENLDVAVTEMSN